MNGVVFIICRLQIIPLQLPHFTENSHQIHEFCNLLKLENFGDSILNSIYFYINHTLSVARKLSILSPKFTKSNDNFYSCIIYTFLTFDTVSLTILFINPEPKSMNELIEELKVKLIDILNLPDVTPNDFDEHAQLVGGELGIDSIDVLEMVVMVEKDYGIIINSQEVGEKVFSSLAALAAYIKENQPDSSS